MEQDLYKEHITFSFGKNWRSYVDSMTDDRVEGARKDIEEWLGHDGVQGKTVLDIGCGSGIHSLSYYLLGAKEILSFDADKYSIEATQILWEKAGRPSNWRIQDGSILDREFIGNLDSYDIVYSWGVLHHTGSLWKAIDNACSLVAPGGLLWISIYVKGPRYPQHLALKQAYNQASVLGKKFMVWKEIYKMMRLRVSWRQNPFAWNTKVDRGMDVYHDLIDWLGGLPYEVASKEEIIDFCQGRGLLLNKVNEVPEGGCRGYLLYRPAKQQHS